MANIYFTIVIDEPSNNPPKDPDTNLKILDSGDSITLMNEGSPALPATSEYDSNLDGYGIAHNGVDGPSSDFPEGDMDEYTYVLIPHDDRHTLIGFAQFPKTAVLPVNDGYAQRGLTISNIQEHSDEIALEKNESDVFYYKKYSGTIVS